MLVWAVYLHDGLSHLYVGQEVGDMKCSEMVLTISALSFRVSRVVVGEGVDMYISELGYSCRLCHFHDNLSHLCVQRGG